MCRCDVFIVVVWEVSRAVRDGRCVESVGGGVGWVRICTLRVRLECGLCDCMGILAWSGEWRRARCYADGCREECAR